MLQLSSKRSRKEAALTEKQLRHAMRMAADRATKEAREKEKEARRASRWRSAGPLPGFKPEFELGDDKDDFFWNKYS